MTDLYPCLLATDQPITCSVTIQDFEGTGRGLVAQNDINEGEIILEIPKDAILSALNIRFSPIFQHFSPEFFQPWAFTGELPGIVIYKKVKLTK